MYNKYISAIKYICITFFVNALDKILTTLFIVFSTCILYYKVNKELLVHKPGHNAQHTHVNWMIMLT